MTGDEWESVALMLDKGFKWREPFSETQSGVYRMLLGDCSVAEVMSAVRSLVAAGQVFGPTPGELVAQIHHDPSKPTPDEALTLIRRALRAGRRPLGGDFGSEAEMIAAREDMVRVEARGMHPLVGAFVARCGDVSRLADEVAEALGGGEFAGVRRRELEGRWVAHVEAMEGRDVASIAEGGRRGGLARLDPLAALAVPRRPAAEITEGQR